MIPKQSALTIVRPIHVLLTGAFAVLSISGCGGGTTKTAVEGPPGATAPATLDADSETAQAVRTGLSQVINEAGFRYLPLVYKYNEELLNILDQVEAHLSGRSEGPPPRFMAGSEKRPGMSAEEEVDHFRETIRRWHEKTGKDLRKEVDALKAEVAARKPDGPRYHPDFHKRFSAAFDDFIAVEVAEIRERRNQYIHEHVKPLFDKYRATSPALIKAEEEMLNKPPYNLPAKSPTAAPASVPVPAPSK
jgi:hypothetical protein